MRIDWGIEFGDACALEGGGGCLSVASQKVLQGQINPQIGDYVRLEMQGERWRRGNARRLEVDTLGSRDLPTWYLFNRQPAPTYIIYNN